MLTCLSVAFPGAGKAQVTAYPDTVIKVTGGSFLKTNEKRIFVAKDTVISLPFRFKNALEKPNEKALAFYDSLKSKSQKSKLTRALYDLVIVAPDTSGSIKVNRRSDENFSTFSGLTIRGISIRQVDVFGGNIYNPADTDHNRLEKLLNRTHYNTREEIIRKNLLISEGDTISSLTLTDNERILRQLPFIDDARILVVPASESDAEIIIITKDVYSLGADFTYRGINKGSVWLYDKNIFGTGHEIKLEIPYSSASDDSPGIGINYNVTNIAKTFTNMTVSFYDGLGRKSYGASLLRNLVGSETRYAFGISVSRTMTSEDLDTLPVAEPLRYNFQDYWLQRSFMLNRQSVTRFVAGIRYINNNVFRKPEIEPDTYYRLQRYRLYLGSAAISMQKYYKTSLIYSYGRTEDIPYGLLFSITGGLEDNEFKNRIYAGSDASFGFSLAEAGYFHISTGAGFFLHEKKTEQGVFTGNIKYVSNLTPAGRYMIRNFINLNYTAGIRRYRDEFISVIKEDAFSSFTNDSLKGTRRLKAGLESVIFSPVNYYGFRFAFFGFAEAVLLEGLDAPTGRSSFLSAIGLGLRIRNDNLVFKTFQIRLGYYPSLPRWSEMSNLVISGENLLRPRNFDPGPPGVIQYR
ncbi:MAG: hypothetical protein GYA43_04480 [Bacteroidales bacterium]|nr:hypothetical protein [Bacteroidales bacterium]